MGTGRIIQADNIDGLKVVKNYISNGLATLNTTGWATYKDAAGTRPVDGTGGSPTLVSFTRSTTSPLDGAASFLFSVAGSSSAQGEGASYDFTIDAAYKAKVLKIEADYIVNSGTFVAGSSTTDSNVIVYIYDVTNGVLIEPSSFKFLSNSTTISDKFSATFQTSATGTSYRLIFHVASTSTAAYALKIDNVSVSPSQYVYGSPVVDLGEYTPVFTNLGTVTFHKFEQYRVGKKLKVKFRFNAASGGASVATVSLPPGLTVSSAGNTVSGAAWAQYTSSKDVFIVTANGESVIRFIFNNGGGASLTGSDFGSGVVDGWFEVDILGWSSSVQVSDGYEGRVVAAKASLASGNFTATASATTIVPFTSVISDTVSGFDGAGGYVIKSAGDYVVEAWMLSASSNTWSALQALQVHVNGTMVDYIAYKNTAQLVSSSFNDLSGAPVQLPNLKTGDVVTIRLRNDMGTGTVWAGSATAQTRFSIRKLSGHPTISASETIGALYTGAPPTGTLNSSFNVATFGTKKKDSHGAYASGVYTVPASGQYDIAAQVRIASVFNAVQNNVIAIFIDGVNAYQKVIQATNGIQEMSPSIDVKSIPLLAGQPITIRVATDGPTPTYSSSSVSSFFSIVRSGGY